ncbi:polysaccharide biosynthesis/export family protein [Sphingobium sp. D43FB]|uniref:polysaccharide biosynthesis/export family protein n=1 Tax=Sphingobium sp. D43FB TaxID=2017595 RepID=UPI000BB583C0|nr:polysaccharide biosynthesis/export family protein [Sphingobium sp. D43FB]PBN43052.1 capsular biosynthesis protein [Sphingobium sp. D43FB]
MNCLSHLHNGARLPRLCLLAALLATAACTSVGPGTKHVVNAGKQEGSAIQGIQVIRLDERSLVELPRQTEPDFATGLGYSNAVGETVGSGDVLNVTIWEAPPAVLFGGMMSPGISIQTSAPTSLPEFLIGPSGSISVPFAGLVPAAGRTLPQIEQDIVARLRGKAHLPQVAVRLIRNLSANVSVVGEVAASTRMPLTPKGETILDAIAAAGGTKQQSDKMTIQVSRGGQVYSMPFSAVINDPRQNVVLRTGDVVTALFQPYSFTMLGAAGRSQEVPFEATGLSLAQAMGRVGGLQEGRADPKGVFLFRWEDPTLVPNRDSSVSARSDGRIPVIYRVDMKDPATYFAMQNFAIRNQDVLYVSTNPIAEFQRVVGLIASTTLPVVSINNAVNRN